MLCQLAAKPAGVVSRTSPVLPSLTCHCMPPANPMWLHNRLFHKTWRICHHHLSLRHTMSRMASQDVHESPHDTRHAAVRPVPLT